MGLDASIPLQGLLINRNDENLKKQRLQMGQLEMQRYQQEGERRKRLGDLLPGAAKGDQAAIDELYSVDPEVAMRMDDRQREIAKARVGDLSSAVRWADTPEKWAQVQQHYAQEGIDLTPYRYEDRERGLLALGQLGSYLESLPKPGNQPASVQEYEYAKGQGFNGSYTDFMNDKRGPLVANNGDGTFTLIPRGYGGNQGRPSAQPPAPPPPGFVIDGGPTRSASGGFPPSGN